MTAEIFFNSQHYIYQIHLKHLYPTHNEYTLTISLFIFMQTHPALFPLFDFRLFLHLLENHFKLLVHFIINLLTLAINFKKHLRPLHFTRLINPIFVHSSQLYHYIILHLPSLHRCLDSLFIFFFFLREFASSFSLLAQQGPVYFLLFYSGRLDCLVKKIFTMTLKTMIDFLPSHFLKA